MKPFSLLIKPASADCNVRCEYCFYLKKSALYPDTKIHRMNDTVLEKMISTYMATDQPQYVFGWQGGEPTLMGPEFFRKVTKLQQQYGRKGVFVSNGLQTNATLIDDEFAAHLGEYRFLVGVSMDGPADIHDTYRKNAAGRGTHADVMRGIEALRKNAVEFNVLVLVSQANVARGAEVYRYMRDMGLFYHQYIPCVEFDGKGNRLPFAITGPEWGKFIIDIFNEWIKADTRKVSVRLFDSILSYLVDGSRDICRMGKNCCQYFVVEHNGDIYPCDFFVDEGLKLGNVANSSWEKLQRSAEYRNFGKQKSQWNKKCSGCKWLKYCLGDCLKHRLYGGMKADNISWLCEGWMMFYEHAMPAFRKLADEIREQRARESEERRKMLAASGREPERNDACPCGSGKKYKNCCGKT